MLLAEKSGSKAILVAVEAPLLDVVVSADAVRQLVLQHVAVRVSRRRPRGYDDRRFFLSHGQLQTPRSARHCTSVIS